MCDERVVLAAYFFLKDRRGVGVAQWQEHSPLTNATRVRLLAWEVCELGLRSLSDVEGFLRVLRFPPPTKTANYTPTSEHCYLKLNKIKVFFKVYDFCILI